jgi:DNA ligase-1
MDNYSKQKLQRLSKFLKEVKSTTSSNEKVNIIKSYSDIKDLFAATYNSGITYGIASKSLETPVSDRLVNYDNLDELLRDLSNRTLTGYDAIYAVQNFCDTPEEKEVLFKIIQRDFKIRIGAKLFNKAIPNCVKVFDVTLAERLDKVLESKTPIDYLNGSYFASRKYDGVRLLCFIDTKAQTVKPVSREGLEYQTLQNLYEPLYYFAKAFQEINHYDGIVVTDGEGAVQTPDGSDDFKTMVSLVKRYKEGFQIPNPRYNIFDIVTEDEFYGSKDSPVLLDRYEMLKKVFDLAQAKLNHRIIVVQQTQITSQKQLDEMFDLAQKRKEEGLILRKNIPFETGRSNNMLKVKKMHHIELNCSDVEFENMEVVDNGVQRTEKMLSAIICDFEGGTVRVGSGFTKEERRKYFTTPSLIIGKPITVQYFEKTSNRDGSMSLRFPIFCGIRDYE